MTKQFRRGKFADFASLVDAVQVEETGSGGGKWWETIAAFNCKTAALAYLLRCQEARPDLTYRLITLQ